MKSKLTNNSILVVALLLAIATFTAISPAPIKANYDWLKPRLEATKAFTLKVFQAMPEGDYSFRPNEEQRTFGAQAYHVAYSIDYFKRAMVNPQAPWSPGDEDSKSKAELIKWASDQFDAMHKMILETESSDAVTAGIMYYLDHNAHHRGQMVSYLRMKGIKPPTYR